jgi:hypothetical protein
MDKSYQVKAKEIIQKLKTYEHDISNIFANSSYISKDIVTYVLQVLRDDNNPEIGKVIVEVAFKQQVTMVTILKVLVKVLYVVKHIKRYRSTDYYQLKQFIDKTIDNIGTTKAMVTKKKYLILLDKIMEEDLAVNLKKDKTEIVEDIKDTINRQYLNFI